LGCPSLVLARLYHQLIDNLLYLIKDKLTTKMKPKLSLTLLLPLIASICLAKKNFTKAKVITIDKDTISGYINYKE
jgi:hypothetical protein